MSPLGEKEATFIMAPFMTVIAAPGSVFIRLSANPEGINSALCEMTTQEAFNLCIHLNQAVQQSARTGNQGINFDSLKAPKILPPLAN